ncbi:MAG TPA: hypothetical protein VHT68_06160, partial [Pseudolabrys sp.]|nr:hypothetical protein [Pseudolabrys sp.]
MPVFRLWGAGAHVIALEPRRSLSRSASWLRPPFCPCAFAVAREHTLGRLQLAELASELLALRIRACERLADPLLLLGDLANVDICTFATERRLIRLDQS